MRTGLLKVSLLVIVALAALTLLLSGCGLSEPEQRFNAGVDPQEQGRLEEAIKGYDEAIRLDPQDADSYHKRGFAYFNLGQYERAIEDYDEAIRLNSQYTDAYIARGNAYANLGQPQRAIDDFDEAIRLDPQHALAYYNRGNAYTNLGPAPAGHRGLRRGYPP